MLIKKTNKNKNIYIWKEDRLVGDVMAFIVDKYFYVHVSEQVPGDWYGKQEKGSKAGDVNSNCGRTIVL